MLGDCYHPYGSRANSWEGRVEYSPVVYLPHEANTRRATFVEMAVEGLSAVARMTRTTCCPPWSTAALRSRCLAI